MQCNVKRALGRKKEEGRKEKILYTQERGEMGDAYCMDNRSNHHVNDTSPFYQFKLFSRKIGAEIKLA